MRSSSVLLTGLVLAFLSRRASADLSLYEPFTYSNGNLDGNTNPTAPATLNGIADTNKWTTGTAGAGKVVDGDLTYPGLPTTASGHMGQLRNATLPPERIGIGEFTESSNPTLYFSLLLQVPAGASTFGTSNTTGSFLTGFQYNPSNLSGAGMADTTA